MELPELGERHLVYENPYQKVYTTHATFPNFTKEYFVTDFGPRAGLVAVKGDRVLLVSQYRLPKRLCLCSLGPKGTAMITLHHFQQLPCGGA